jgi:hypothetical protein
MKKSGTKKAAVKKAAPKKAGARPAKVAVHKQGGPRSPKKADPREAEKVAGTEFDQVLDRPPESPAPETEVKSRGAGARPRPAATDGLCTFAIRLPEAHRDAFHRAAGPAGASRLAREVLVAVANMDEEVMASIFAQVRRRLAP